MTNVTTHRRAAHLGRETTSSHLQQNVETLTRQELIDNYVLKRVNFRTRRLAIQFGLSDDRRDDLHQDMVLELLKAADRFDPDGAASWHTYACRVLDLAVKKLTQSECRRRHRESLQPPRSDMPSDGIASPADPIDERANDLAHLELKLDVGLVLDRLPHRLREMCLHLMHRSRTETAEAMGMHRNSMHRLVDRARAYFEQAGFDDSDAADSALRRM